VYSRAACQRKKKDCMTHAKFLAGQGFPPITFPDTLQNFAYCRIEKPAGRESERRIRKRNQEEEYCGDSRPRLSVEQSSTLFLAGNASVKARQS